MDEEKRADVAAVVMLVVIIAGVAWALSYAFDMQRAGTPSGMIAIGATYTAASIGGVVYAWREGLLKRWFIPASGDLTRGFVAAMLLFALAFGFVKLITMHGSPRAAWMARLYLQLGDTKPLRDHQAWVGVGIALAATMEEIVWRGWVKSLLERLFGRRFGWIVAACAYALAHVPTLWALSDSTLGNNPIVLIAALGAGLVWSALARVFADRLTPSIISHGLFDWAVLMMFRLWGPSV